MVVAVRTERDFVINNLGSKRKEMIAERTEHKRHKPSRQRINKRQPTIIRALTMEKPKERALGKKRRDISFIEEIYIVSHGGFNFILHG